MDLFARSQSGTREPATPDPSSSKNPGLGFVHPPLIQGWAQVIFAPLFSRSGARSPDGQQFGPHSPGTMASGRSQATAQKSRGRQAIEVCRSVVSQVAVSIRGRAIKLHEVLLKTSVLMTFVNLPMDDSGNLSELIGKNISCQRCRHHFELCFYLRSSLSRPLPRRLLMSPGAIGVMTAPSTRLHGPFIKPTSLRDKIPLAYLPTSALIVL